MDGMPAACPLALGSATGKRKKRRPAAWLWPLVAPVGLGLVIVGGIAAADPAIVSLRGLLAQVREPVVAQSSARAAVAYTPLCQQGGAGFQYEKPFPVPDLGGLAPAGLDGLRNAVNLAKVFGNPGVFSGGRGTGERKPGAIGAGRKRSAPLLATEPRGERASAALAYAETARGKRAPSEPDRRPRLATARAPLARGPAAPQPAPKEAQEGALRSAHGRQGFVGAA
jgi:hypothetical protein